MRGTLVSLAAKPKRAPASQSARPRQRSSRSRSRPRPSEAAGGVGTTLDLQELSERCGAEGELNPTKVGEPAEWAVDGGGAKVLMAGGQTLRMLVACGAWSHLDFRRVQRSFIYRKKEGGEADVHRVLANTEDVLKTRSLPPLEKARVVQVPTYFVVRVC